MTVLQVLEDYESMSSLSPKSSAVLPPSPYIIWTQPKNPSLLVAFLWSSSMLSSSSMFSIHSGFPNTIWHPSHGLSRAEYRVVIASLVLKALPLLMVHVSFVRICCWLKLSLQFTNTPRSFSDKLLSKTFLLHVIGVLEPKFDSDLLPLKSSV